ncbi:MAG: preprotein translocase subunit SecA [Eubacteriales bacterium]|jgi:preprotein translocase subunit SecA
MGLFDKIFGTHSERELKKIYPLVDAIEALSDEYRQLSDDELKGKTEIFRARLANGETLDDILVEAFATAREAAWRVLGMYPFRVQLIGGIVLHQGRIAEMKTGEGKTLVAVLPAYLNGLTGKGVHIVTVNDYLARYHSEWMGKVYRYLGLSVGLIVHGVDQADRRKSYAADVTYGTNNEFGFDYLRDNMAIYKENMVQRGHVFAIVDEVDSILIDEARTPLIISGQGDKSTQLYEMADRFASRLKATRVRELDDRSDNEDIDGDYIVDEKAKTVTLTAQGIAKAERAFNIENLSDPENATLAHHINQAIRAHGLMKRDVDYVVKDGEVIIIDEFTGRMMFGRRYSEGLHQAIEAKEKVKVERESKTLATITFQNYFRLYDKLSGMTGTALTETEEFGEIYKLDVIEIPTNRPMIRIDHPDVVYKTIDGKNRAIIKQIQECNRKGQPVLVGTVSIEKSEELSAMLKKVGIQHNVLNAKHHDKEAEIVAQAGKLGAVTIATNMAGRGTDIMLGGNAEFMARRELRRLGYSDELIAEADGHSITDDESILEVRAKFNELVEQYKAEIKDEAKKVIQAGGLFVIGTERHESRRIDNQLRGRSGRQGDPGESRFYISLEDDLMRLFGSERIFNMMETLGLDEDTPIDQKMLSNAIESAQKRIESRHYQMRKNVLEYDDVMNRQREIIYGQRKQVLDGEDLKPSIMSMIEETIFNAVDRVMGEQRHANPTQIKEITLQFEPLFLKKGELSYTQQELDNISVDQIKQDLLDKAIAFYDAKEQELTSPVMREIERYVLLKMVDQKWMDHIDAMHELRRGIGLRAYGQHDPKLEYKREGFDMFEAMINSIREDTVKLVFTARVQGQAPQREQVAKPLNAIHGDDVPARKSTPVRKQKIGRNDPCPCGSGKKYKKCCGFNPTVSGSNE